MSVQEKPPIQVQFVEQIKGVVYPQSPYVRRNRGVFVRKSVSAASFAGFIVTSGHDFIETFPEVINHSAPTQGQAFELVTSLILLGMSLLAIHSARMRRKTI